MKGNLMEKKINNILFFTDENGEQLVFRVLFTYYSENFNKDYAVFYNEKDENHLIAYTFDENNVLDGVETPEEYAELEEMLKKYDEENKAEQ